jgi:hypothetical protein
MDHISGITQNHSKIIWDGEYKSLVEPILSTISQCFYYQIEKGKIQSKHCIIANYLMLITSC